MNKEYRITSKARNRLVDAVLHNQASLLTELDRNIRALNRAVGEYQPVQDLSSLTTEELQKIMQEASQGLQKPGITPVAYRALMQHYNAADLALLKRRHGIA